MGLFSIRHNVKINSGEIIDGMDRIFREHFKSTEEAIRRTTQSTEALVKDSGAFMDIIGTSFANMQYLAEDTVKSFQTYFILLLISISLFFFAVALSFLASAWKKTRETKATTTTNIFLIMSPETPATSHLIDEIIRKQIEN